MLISKGAIVTVRIVNPETPEPDKIIEFVEKLTNLMFEYNIQISGSHEGDVELLTKNSGGRMVGYWPGYVTKETFRDLR